MFLDFLAALYSALEKFSTPTQITPVQIVSYADVTNTPINNFDNLP